MPRYMRSQYDLDPSYGVTESTEAVDIDQVAYMKIVPDAVTPTDISVVLYLQNPARAAAGVLYDQPVDLANAGAPIGEAVEPLFFALRTKTNFISPQTLLDVINWINTNFAADGTTGGFNKEPERITYFWGAAT